MLLADKHDLQEKLKLSLVLIEEKELNFYTQNCYTVGTQAALLSGFAFTAIMSGTDWEGISVALQVFWSSMTTLAMIFEIMAVVKSMQLSIMGPGLALRGPEGSMTRAVLAMRSEYKNIHRCFYTGLFFFHVSAALYFYTTYDIVVAPINTVLLVMALTWLYVDFTALEKRLRLPGRHQTYNAQTSVIQSNRESSAYSNGSPSTFRASTVHSRFYRDNASRYTAGSLRKGTQRSAAASLRRKGATTLRSVPRFRNPIDSFTKKRTGSISIRQPPDRSGRSSFYPGSSYHPRDSACPRDSAMFPVLASASTHPPHCSPRLEEGTGDAMNSTWHGPRTSSFPREFKEADTLRRATSVPPGTGPGSPLRRMQDSGVIAEESAIRSSLSGGFEGAQSPPLPSPPDLPKGSFSTATAPAVPSSSNSDSGEAHGGVASGVAAGQPLEAAKPDSPPKPEAKPPNFVDRLLKAVTWPLQQQEESRGPLSPSSRRSWGLPIDVIFHVVLGGEKKDWAREMSPDATLHDARNVVASALGVDADQLALYMEMERGRAEPVGTTDATLRVPLHVLCMEMGIEEGSGVPLHLWAIQK